MSITNWTTKHDWDPIPKSVLPRRGRVGFYSGAPVACAFGYVDPSANICFLTYLIVDPDAPTIPRIRSLTSCVKELMAEVSNEWTEPGIFYEITQSVGVQRLLKNMGFHKGERGMVSMISTTGKIGTGFLEE